MSDEGRVKVLYIAGYGRSGTTILANTLGEADGFFNVGEARYVWDRGLLRDWYCGCGNRFRECVFWTNVLEQAYGSLDAVDATEMIAYLTPWSRSLRIWLDRVHIARRALEKRSVADFTEHLKALYRAVREISGCEVIVDESKWPDYGYILSRIPSLDVRILHLHRDPRAVANSWRKPRKFEPDPSSGIYTPAHSPGRTALEWTVWSLAVRDYCRRADVPCMEISYEDFVANPGPALSAVFRFVGREHIRLPLSDQHEVFLTENHAVSGHPVRFARGRLRLELDGSWRSELSWMERALVSVLTWPLARADLPGRG